MNLVHTLQPSYFKIKFNTVRPYTAKYRVRSFTFKFSENLFHKFFVSPMKTTLPACLNLCGSITITFVTSYILTTASTKMTVFWNVAPCSVDCQTISTRLHGAISQKTVIFIITLSQKYKIVKLLFKQIFSKLLLRRVF
jgi:hypothetical protein